jgi:hypothetical protein
MSATDDPLYVAFLAEADTEMEENETGGFDGSARGAKIHNEGESSDHTYKGGPP